MRKYSRRLSLHIIESIIGSFTSFSPISIRFNITFGRRPNESFCAPYEGQGLLLLTIIERGKLSFLCRKQVV